MRIRATKKEDRALVQEWMEADPEHRARGEASLFVEPGAGLTQFAVIDDLGQPVFFVTLEKTTRGHIQFCPEAAKGRNLKGLLWLGGFLRRALPKVGVREFVTESRYAPLIAALERGLGMRRLVADYSAAIRGEQGAGNRE